MERKARDGSSRPASGPVLGEIKDLTFMRRIALSGLLLLSGCTGFGHFIGDTHTFSGTPNSPAGDSAKPAVVAVYPIICCM